MKITISNYIQIADAPSFFVQEIKKSLTMQNPEYIEKIKRGYWTGNTPETLKFYHNTCEGLEIPRGYARKLLFLAREHGIDYQLIDRRRTLLEVSFEFKGMLKPFQDQAVRDVLSRDQGVLEAPTGSGKTVMALKNIAERKQPALVITHTRELMNQWQDRIEAFLNIPQAEIGVIGNGEMCIGKRITVAIINSLYKVADQVAPRIGHLIVDECHRTPSRTFTEAVSMFDCKYLLGLSATPFRRDGLTRVIYMYLGDRAHQVSRKMLQQNGDILKANVAWRETTFLTPQRITKAFYRNLRETRAETP